MSFIQGESRSVEMAVTELRSFLYMSWFLSAYTRDGVKWVI